MRETPEQQEANRKLRKGMKRPEHGEWPVAKLAKSKALKVKKERTIHTKSAQSRADDSLKENYVNRVLRGLK